MGPRPAGSQNEKKAAMIIKDAFVDMGMNTYIQENPFIGWDISKSPKLELLYPSNVKIPVEALTYSGPIEVEKISVNVRKLVKTELSRGVPAHSYSFTSKDRNIELARVYIRDFGPACAFNSKRPRSLLPEIVLGEDYQEYFNDLVKKEKIILSLSLKSKINTKAVTRNIFASYNDIEYMDKIIIIGAHYDTVYCSSGANDNASGIYAIQKIASALSAISKDIGLIFIAYGAEEIGLFGSKMFFDWIKYNGYLKKIKAIINLDMVGAGDPNWFNVTDDEINFKGIINSILKSSCFREEYGVPNFETPPWMTSDHAEFTNAGIPTLFISYRGNRYPYIHTMQDTIDKIDINKIDFAIELVRDVISRLVKRF
jgi:hypothetical protein